MLEPRTVRPRLSIVSSSVRWCSPMRSPPKRRARSEEHTSELQSRQYLVCRLLLEKKTRSAAGHRRVPAPLAGRAAVRAAADPPRQGGEGGAGEEDRKRVLHLGGVRSAATSVRSGA